MAALRGKPGVAVTNYGVAARLRAGESFAAVLKETSLSRKNLTGRLQRAGYGIDGHPVKPDHQRRGDLRTCGRCGVKREVHRARHSPLCIDCKDVSTDLGDLDGWSDDAA